MQLKAGAANRVGLVSTNSIRNGASRRVLERLIEVAPIFEAWSDEPWVVDGAAVRVSLVCCGREKQNLRLNGNSVSVINADLTALASDLTLAGSLHENTGISFQGFTKGGPFEIDGLTARQWLLEPVNPNGRGNADVLRPIKSGGDLVKRREEAWVVDFSGQTQDAASLYQSPFEQIAKVVKPFRALNKRPIYRDRWWIFAEARPGLRKATATLNRCIVTPKVSRHRVFLWLHPRVAPDNLVIAIARDDDTTFGVLHSRFHERWSLVRGAFVGAGNDPTYTPTSTFETFPFPAGLTPDRPAASYATDPRAIRIASAAQTLNRLRENWLNPSDLVKRVPEVVPGFPDRILPVNAAAAEVLKKRTLTSLYNQRPTWLANAHAELDAAVAAAYGWPEDIGEEDALERLLKLNLERSKGS
ncbi:hypothetical protein ABEG18_14615 [Alsobacter sp. KACC 23698]|uniref:Class I SAM-dependent DNA methyltransferase n=1 Tax=Alsobacter sp. KACC 23698 TaxID=3149229 RepID=A0AAU7JA78_9HYPH